MTLAAQAMPCWEDDMQKDKIFAKIGELTVQFATLEHQLQSLLELQGMSHEVQHLSYRLRQA